MRFGRKMYLGTAGLMLAVGSLLTLLTVMGTNASALTMGDRRDCGYTDVILDCGATSQSELLEKYDENNDGRGNHDIQAIYSHYGIKRSDIAGTTSEVKRGWLDTSGVITVDGKTVATQAQSLYRVKVDKPVSPTTINGKTYYIGNVNGGYRKGADVYVFFKNGVFYSAIQASCGNPIPAKPHKPQPKPAYKCENLKATKLDRTRFRFTAAASARNGAEIVSYTFDFGDDQSETSDSNIVEHEYAAAGTYTATVSVNVEVNGELETASSPYCTVVITVVEKKEYCPLPGKEHLPVDSPECKEEEKCPIPGKEHLPKDSPECVETPPELPQTGIDPFIGGGLAIGSLTAAGYYYASSRRNLLGSMLNR